MSNDSYVARKQDLQHQVHACAGVLELLMRCILGTSVGLMNVNYNGGIASRMPVVFSQTLAPRSPGMFTQDFQQTFCRADASPGSGSLTSACLPRLRDVLASRKYHHSPTGRNPKLDQEKKHGSQQCVTW
ncbi:hypothetical protein E4U59_001453 [Claviceps monticola]|nr:hypothetical protein E4U59_001453 [Claviceps monticola]